MIVLALHRNQQRRSVEVRLVAVLLVVGHRIPASPYPELLGSGSSWWRREEGAQSIGAVHQCSGTAAGVPPTCRLVAVCIAGWVH